MTVRLHDGWAPGGSVTAQREQQAEAMNLDAAIAANLEELEFGS